MRTVWLRGCGVTAAFAMCVPLSISNHPKVPNFHVSAALAAEGRPLHLDAPVQFSALPMIEVRAGRLSDQGGGGAVDESGEKPASVWSGKSLQLSNAEIAVDLSRTRLSPERGDDKSLVREDAPLFETLKISDTALLITDGQSEPFRIFVNNAVLSASAGSWQFSGQAERRGVPIDFAITALKSFVHSESGLTVYPVKARFSNELASTVLSGEFTADADLKLISENFELRVFDIPRLMSWLGLAWPGQRTVGTFSAEGKLEWSSLGLAFLDSRFLIGGNAADGSLLVGRRGGRTALDATLAFDRLDLSRYRDEAPDDEPAAVAAAAIIVEPETSRPFSSGEGTEAADTSSFVQDLKVIDLDLRVSAQRVIYGVFAATDVAATVALRGGKLVADIAEMTLEAGGSGTVQMSTDGSLPVPKTRLLAKFENLALDEVSRMMFGAPVVSGSGRVTARLSGEQETHQLPIETMVGAIEIQSDTAVKLGIIDLPTLVSGAVGDGAALSDGGSSAGPDQVWNTARLGSTEFDRFHGYFAIGQGRILAERIFASVGPERIEARGSTDLGEEKLAFNIWFGRVAEVAPWTGLMVRSAKADNRTSAHGLSGDFKSGYQLQMNGDWRKPQIEVKKIPERQAKSAQQPLNAAGAGTTN